MTPISSKEKEAQEKRRHRRSNIMLKVSYHNAKEFLADYTENISEGGVFIATNETFEEGTTIDFEISFPSLLDPIALKGIVNWCRPAQPPEQQGGIGVQFIQEQPSKKRPISTLVAKLESPDIESTDSSRLFRVLLVEDNLVVRDMFRYGIQKLSLQGKFSGAQLEVLETDNGKEALELLKRQEIHLLILDLYIPILDGIKVIQHVRQDENTKDLPIVVVSAAESDDRELAFQCGADIYLSKPIKLKEMVESVGALFSAINIPKDSD